MEFGMYAILKKLQKREGATALLIIDAPTAYAEVLAQETVHTQPQESTYDFVQIFGTSQQ